MSRVKSVYGDVELKSGKHVEFDGETLYTTFEADEVKSFNDLYVIYNDNTFDLYKTLNEVKSFFSKFF